MFTPLRVGILGTGRAGQCHATAYSRLQGVNITSLWNRTRAKAEKFAASLNQTNLKIYDHWRDLIQDEQVDAVSITTDPIFRRKPFLEALANQKHILVEKPLSLNFCEAHEMSTLAEKTKLVTAISFNWRYSPACQTMRRALHQQQIGQLLNTRSDWRLRISALRSWSSASGSLREAGSHEFDRIRFLTGCDVKRLICHLRSYDSSDMINPKKYSTGSETYAWILCELSNQKLAAFNLGITLGEPERRIIISGELGTLILNNDWVTIQKGKQNKNPLILGNEIFTQIQKGNNLNPIRLRIAEEDKQPSEILSGQHTWNRLIADFVTAVRHKDYLHEMVPYLPKISDGLLTQEIIKACEISHIEQRWVKLSEIGSQII